MVAAVRRRRPWVWDDWRHTRDRLSYELSPTASWHTINSDQFTPLIRFIYRYSANELHRSLIILKQVEDRHRQRSDCFASSDAMARFHSKTKHVRSTLRPWRTTHLVDLYRLAKFGCNRCSSFGCYALADEEYTWRTTEPFVWKHNVIYKTGSTCRNAVRGAPSHDNSKYAQTLVMFGRVVSEICKRTDGQIKIHTDKLSLSVIHQLVFTTR